MSIKIEEYGRLASGELVRAYTINASNGNSLKVLNYGGIVSSLIIGGIETVCGFDSADGYINGGGSHGALIGRYANRIANGKFALNGTDYELAKNEKGITHLHGGNVGFSKRIWNVQPIQPDKLVMSLTCEDGEEGYPSKLEIRVTYSFDGNDFGIHYEGRNVGDKDTVLNMTNHAYFNLGGYDSGDVLGDMLLIDSDFITEIDEKLLPTGKLLPVDDTMFDFRVMRPIKHAYDHNFVLNADGTIKLAAQLCSPKTGIFFELWTNMPAVQLYDAVMMDNPTPFRGGVKQEKFHGVCLETQFFPDSPNHPTFPSCTLKPDAKYDYTTIFKF